MNNNDALIHSEVTHHASVIPIWGWALSLGGAGTTQGFTPALNALIHTLMYTHYLYPPLPLFLFFFYIFIVVFYTFFCLLLVLLLLISFAIRFFRLSSPFLILIIIITHIYE